MKYYILHFSQTLIIMRRIIAIIIVACVTMSTTQAKNIIRPENPSAACAQAWQNYQKADALWKTGWGLFGAGLGLGIAGGVMYPIGAFGNSSSQTGNLSSQAVATTGLAFLCVGSGMVVASVPCLAVGQVRRKAALKEYEEHCSSQQPVVSFHLQSSSNGLGLAMRF